MIIIALFFCTTVALSPEEFQSFYEPQNTQKHHTFSTRFPLPHFVRPPSSNSMSFNGPNNFIPSRQPQPAKRPFNMQNDFQNIHPSTNKFPLRPLGPFSQEKILPYQNEMNLVKLRKMYSHIKDTNKSPTEYNPNNRFTIPPDYIRNSYGFGHSQIQEQSVHRPFWHPFRQGRGKKSENIIDTYMGPNNKSITFATTLKAAVEVDKKQRKFDPDYEHQFDYQSELEESFSSRPKRFTINEDLLRAFYFQTPTKACTSVKGTDGKCTDYLHCYKTRGIPEYSKQCGYEACCVYSIKSCGRTTNKNDTTWEMPEDKNYGDSCFLRVAKISQAICHLRLDLKQFELRGPTNGSCLTDKLVVSGQNINSIIPRLCGTATGEHLYVDVDNVTGPVEINIVSVGNFDRKWNIKVSQIECDNQNKPPRNCLQYYTNTTGTFGSFNRNNITRRQYLNNLNYVMCIKKPSTFCSIQYEITPQNLFNFTNTADNGMPTVTAGMAGVGPVDCPDDYIVIAGNRLCGDRFNDGTNPTMTANAKIKDSTNGPFIIQVKSNEIGVAEGFQLNYYQIPCS